MKNKIIDLAKFKKEELVGFKKITMNIKIFVI